MIMPSQDEFVVNIPVRGLERVSESRMLCVETVPPYNDAEYPVFNIKNEMRTTCIFKNMFFDVLEKHFLFLTQDTISVPLMSIMGRGMDYQAPDPFPSSLIVEEIDFKLDSYPFRPYVTMLSRTHENHHGHTLFDGVLSIWFSLMRNAQTIEEIYARDVVILITDGKGVASMDDRFSLISGFPLFYNGVDDLAKITNESFVHVERMVIGLAGLGWAFSPITASWRGQLLRDFQQYAFYKIGYNAEPEVDEIRIVIIERIPSKTLSDGKQVNYFARSIHNAPHEWKNLASNISGVVWEHVFFENTSLLYQINVMQRASIVITLEGCAMENTPFMREGTALIGLQYNRIWQHYDHISAQHFVEYAELVHVLMVDTRIEERYKHIQNSGGDFPVHLYPDLLRRAVLDAISLVQARRICPPKTQCGSLRRYHSDNSVLAAGSVPPAPDVSITKPAASTSTI